MAGAADLLADDLRSGGAGQVTLVDDASVCCHFRGSMHTLRIGVLGSVGIILDDATIAVPDLSPVLASLRHGMLSELGLGPRPRFRVELTDGTKRQIVITALHDRLGWANDPADWQLNLARRHGLWVAEVGQLHYSRRFGRLRRQPWSTNPVVASVLVRMAKIRPNQTVHDPCCGTGTLLIAAGLVAPSLRISGTDHDHETLERARSNLFDQRLPARLAEADAIPIPHPPGTVDRIICNLPFGKQVGSHSDNLILYQRLMHEIARTLRADGRAVLLTEDKRLLVEATAATPGVKIIRDRLLRYNGATPTAYVITRTRTDRRRR